MYQDKMHVLREQKLKRMTSYSLMTQRSNEDPQGDYSYIANMPFEEIPCNDDEKQELYNFASERLQILEQDLAVFFAHCMWIRTMSWPRNFVATIFSDREIELPASVEQLLEKYLDTLNLLEKRCIQLLYKDGKNWDDICDQLNIYVVELNEHINHALRRLRNPQSNFCREYYQVVEGKKTQKYQRLIYLPNGKFIKENFMYIIKKGWKQITNGRLYNLYIEVMKHAQELKLWNASTPYPPLFTRKSVSAFGTCFTQRNKNGTFDSTIVLNEILIEHTDDQIRKIIVHEVAHAIVPFEHHSVHWRQVANTLGKGWGYAIERVTTDDELCKELNKFKGERHPYKHELYCPKCGATWQYKKYCEAVKHPEKYQCSKDKTRLKARRIE